MNEENPQNKINHNPELSPIRTFGDDVKNVVQQNNISTSKIFMAEQKKREQEEAIQNVNNISETPNKIKTAISVLFILLGLGSIYFAITFLIPKIDSNKPVQVIIEKNSFFDVNSIKEINISNLTSREVLAKIRETIVLNSNLNEGEIVKIKLYRDIEIEEDGKASTKKVEISTQEFLEIIQTRAPDALVRNLGNEFLLGAHKYLGQNEPFIIFIIKDRDLIFANMFNWEKDLIEDIQDIFFTKLGSSNVFNENLNQVNNIATSTATTTKVSTSTEEFPPVPESPYNPLNFVDLILNNKDTRAIISNDNEILFFYSIVNPSRLVFSNNLETFKTLNQKINNAEVVK